VPLTKVTHYDRVGRLPAVTETIDAILGVLARYELLTDPIFHETMEQFKQSRQVENQLSLTIQVQTASEPIIGYADVA